MASLGHTLELDLGAGSDPIGTSELTIADGACDVEAAVYVSQPAIRAERPPHAANEQSLRRPMQGRTVGHDLADDLTQGREVGETLFTIPRRAANTIVYVPSGAMGVPLANTLPLKTGHWVSADRRKRKEDDLIA